MSTLESIKSELQEIIADSNATTGGNATTVRDGVDALIEGFGSGDLSDIVALLGDGEVVEGSGSGGGTGSLDGLENGYDVMFYDENNEELAFYSIKKGHTINPPIYNCDGWQNADKEIIIFPYTPTQDIIFYPLNSTLVDKLYEFYDVDKAICPYVGVFREYISSTNVKGRIVFFSTFEKFASEGLTLKGTIYHHQTSKYSDNDWSMDATEFISQIMERIPTISLYEQSSLSFSTNTNNYTRNFINFECDWLSGTTERIDQ